MMMIQYIWYYGSHKPATNDSKHCGLLLLLLLLSALHRINLKIPGKMHEFLCCFFLHRNQKKPIIWMIFFLLLAAMVSKFINIFLLWSGSFLGILQTRCWSMLAREREQVLSTAAVATNRSRHQLGLWSTYTSRDFTRVFSLNIINWFKAHIFHWF